MHYASHEISARNNKKKMKAALFLVLAFIYTDTLTSSMLLLHQLSYSPKVQLFKAKTM